MSGLVQAGIGEKVAFDDSVYDTAFCDKAYSARMRWSLTERATIDDYARRP